MSSAVHLIATLPKGRDQARICLSEYRGSKLIDLRVWSPFAGPANEWAATKTGLSLPAERIDELLTALIDAKAKARDLGWIGGDA